MKNYKILKHIQGHTVVYSEMSFSKEEQKTFLNKNYLLLDNSKEQPILAYNNPYYGRINPLTGEPNTKYTKETKPLHTLMWKVLLNQPSTVAFRYFSFTDRITHTAHTIKDFTQYCLTHGIRVQLQDLTVDYKTTLEPVQRIGNMQYAYWDQLNDQLRQYNKLLKEDSYLRSVENFKPISLQKYLGPKAAEALPYIHTWLPAYELDYNFPQTEPSTYQIRHKGNPYKGIPETLTTHKKHLDDPKYHSYKIALLYYTLKYYEQIGEPITNPYMLICDTCGNPLSTHDQSPVAPTSIYYELLGNSGYYLEPAPQVTCPHCATEYIYSDGDYFKTESMKDDLIYESKLSGKTYHWRNDPIESYWG